MNKTRVRNSKTSGSTIILKLDLSPKGKITKAICVFNELYPGIIACGFCFVCLFVCLSYTSGGEAAGVGVIYLCKWVKMHDVLSPV